MAFGRVFELDVTRLRNLVCDIRSKRGGGTPTPTGRMRVFVPALSLSLRPMHGDCRSDRKQSAGLSSGKCRLGGAITGDNILACRRPCVVGTGMPFEPRLTERGLAGICLTRPLAVTSGAASQVCLQSGNYSAYRLQGVERHVIREKRKLPLEHS